MIILTRISIKIITGIKNIMDALKIKLKKTTDPEELKNLILILDFINKIYNHFAIVVH